MNWREFRLTKNKRTQIWKIRQNGESYETEHGILDGAMQNFSDIPGDKGKPETKAYVNATDNCAFHISREIRKKIEHGYIEFVDGKLVSEQVNEIVWDKPLPKNFCGYKPQTSIEPKALEKIHAQGLARYSRKYNGMCHVAVHHQWGWEVYTRRIDLATEKFPKHLIELESLIDFGVGTILVGEVICAREDGKDDFKAVSRFCRSLPEEARKLIEASEIPEPEFIVFDVLFYNGIDQKNTTYDERAKLLKKLPLRGNGFISHVDYFDLTPETWENYAKEHGWEGFVVTDGSSIPGDKAYSFDGDAKRPKGHYKLKPLYEDDVVIFAASTGSGKRLNGIGSVHIKQKHPETKEWFYCGKVGSGFTDESLSELEEMFVKNNLPIVEKDKDAEKLDLSEEKYTGLVAMIEYGERQPKTQKFLFPVFIHVRDDKGPEECFAQRLAADEE